MDALILCGTVHTAAAMVLFGTLAVRPLLVAESAMAATTGRQERRLMLAAAALALFSAVIWLLLVSRAMADDPAAMTDPGAILTVLGDTAFGRVWQLRLILAVAILGLSLRRRGGDGRSGLLALAALQLASLGLVGHPAMGEGITGFYQKANQAVHLLAGGAWLGALPCLLLLLVEARKGGAWRDLAVALRRFSGFGATAVTLLLLSGAFNVWVRTGGRPGFLDTPYGAILLIKLVLVAGMIALALLNRFVLMPALSRHAMQGQRWLSVSLSVETILGLLVVVVAFVLGNTAPP
jgi:putative copper resistance protein D